jgi:epoxyqueuosine reductase
VGCLRCQTACPENRKFKDWVERKGSFTEEETEWLLAGRATDDNLPAETRRKLEDWGLMEYKKLLDRNLRVLL